MTHSTASLFATLAVVALAVYGMALAPDEWANHRERLRKKGRR